MNPANQNLLDTICRLAVDAFIADIQAAVPAVIKTMNQQSRAAQDADRKRLLAAASMALDAQSGDLGALCGKHVERFFHEKLIVLTSPSANQKLPKPQLSLDDMALVGEHEMQQTIALSKVSKRLKEASEYELYALSRRLELLIDVELDDKSNPCYTEIFCKALLEALTQIGLVQEASLVAFAAFEPELLQGVPPLYTSINAMLISAGILIIVPLPHESVIKRNDMRPGIAQRGANQPGLSLNKEGLAVISASPGAAMQPHMQTASAPLPIERDALTVILDRYRPPQAAIPTAIAKPVDDALSPILMARLRKMQLAIVPMPGAADLESTVPIMARTGADGDIEFATNPIRAVSRKWADELRDSDQVVVDLMARLFEEFFGLGEIPGITKQYLAMLQIPVLKAALLDHEFFSRKDHPVRKFLDHLASLGVRFPGHFSEGGSHHEQLATIVHYLIVQFDADVRDFEMASNYIAGFADQILSEAVADWQILTSELAFAERQQLAAQIAEYEVKRRITHLAYPERIGQFLQTQYGKLLAKDYLIHGEESSVWKEDIAILDEVVLCTESARSDNWERLRDRVSPLMKRFNINIQRARISLRESEAFVQEMVAYHTQILRNVEDLAETGISSPIPAEAAVPVPEFVQADPRSHLPTTAPSAAPGQCLWHRVSEDTEHLLQLVWISPRGVTFLLKDINVNKSLVLSADEYSQKRASGEIRSVIDYHLVMPCLERALIAYTQQETAL